MNYTLDKKELVRVLEKNKQDIENGNWEKVYLDIFDYDRGYFSDFLIQNDVDPNTMFKRYIPSWAFDGCEYLTSITLPNTVIEIRDNAFGSCHSLTKVIIPNTIEEIGRHAFAYCKSLKSVIISNSITKINEWTFHQCESLTSVVIPAGVEVIGAQAFSLCISLKSIILPNSIKEIDDYGFAECDLIEIKYDGTKEDWEKVKLGKDWIKNSPINKKKNKITFLR